MSIAQRQLSLLSLICSAHLNAARCLGRVAKVVVRHNILSRSILTDDILSGKTFYGKTLYGCLLYSCLFYGVFYGQAYQSLCYAGGGPENVFLLVNSNSQNSLTVANHYIDLRKIPPSNVFYVPYQGSKVQISGKAFRERVLLPAIAELKRRKLAEQIDYFVYSCDFPWRIYLAKDFPGSTFPAQQKPYASLTGATYLSTFIQEKRKEIVGLNTNLYFTEPVQGITISRAFRSRYHWAPGGRRTRQGLSYRMSAMLGVTEGRGNTVDEIVQSMRRAQAADGTKPRGTVYYMKHGGPRSKPRHHLFKAAATELLRQGVHAKVVESKFPQYKKNIIGLTCGTAKVDLKDSSCRFLPGAFCDNLTSAGANFVRPKQMIDLKTGKRRTFQVTVCDFIRHGATGASGTVIEPYSIAQKFPTAFFHVHYANGCSLGEAFYQSVAGPYQQLLVGDPLCQPWASIPIVQVKEFANGSLLRGQVKITPQVIHKENVIEQFELFVDGIRIQSCRPEKSFLLDTTTLKDGHHELRVVACDDTPLETQGRLILNVTIKNGRDAIALTTRQKRLSMKDKYVAVHVVSTIEGEVEIFCNDLSLGRVPAGSGTLRIATQKLGSGPVELYAQSEDLRSKSLSLKIGR